MKEAKQFGVFVFREESEVAGTPLKYADSPDECATFSSPAEAQAEISERSIHYGIRTEIVNLDNNVVVIETTDRGRTWHKPTRAHKSAEPILA